MIHVYQSGGCPPLEFGERLFLDFMLAPSTCSGCEGHIKSESLVGFLERAYGGHVDAWLLCEACARATLTKRGEAARKGLRLVTSEPT